MYDEHEPLGKTATQKCRKKGMTEKAAKIG